MKRQKICIMTTSLLIVRFFLIPHIKMLSEDHDVTLVVNVDDKDFLESLGLGIRVQHLPIVRNISLLRDLHALWLTTVLFVRNRFDIVHTVAPKAGIIGMLAAWIARVPLRLHVFQGEVWLSRTGLWRMVLKNLDRMVAFLATNILVVSQSERIFLINQRVISEKKSKVLGDGSISGVDLSVFRADQQLKAEMRKELNINPEDVVFLFVGRLNKDKGINELIKAFRQLLQKQIQNIHLIIVGPDEGEMFSSVARLPQEVLKKLHFVPYFTDRPESYMKTSDVLVLPSHREGFGVVIIEAAAAGLPAIGSKIYGVSDAIVENETGLLFEKGNIQDLAEKMEKLCTDHLLRKKLGESAYMRCKELYNQKKIIELTKNYYDNMVSSFDK